MEVDLRGRRIHHPHTKVPHVKQLLQCGPVNEAVDVGVPSVRVGHPLRIAVTHVRWHCL